MKILVGCGLLAFGLVIRHGLSKAGHYMIDNKKNHPSAKILAEGEEAVILGRRYIRFGNALFFFIVFYIVLAAALSVRH